MALDGFEFYEIEERGAAAATMSFVEGIKEVRGNFRSKNLLKRDAAYRRGKGNSEIWNFRFIPATAYTIAGKTVDLAKLETDYINNGRTTADLQKYLNVITQIKTRWFSRQMYPQARNVLESEPVSKTEALLLDPSNANAGLVARMGSRDFAEAVLASETLENNNTFLDALRQTSFTIQKRRWDGGIGGYTSDDGSTYTAGFETVKVPTYMQYTCSNAYLTISDFGRIRAQLQNNLADVPDLQQQFKILLSPNQFENLIENNEKLQDIRFSQYHGLLETGQIPMIRGFQIEAHPQVKDTEAYAYIPGVTVGVSDWGVISQVKEDANIWTLSTARRQYNYDCMVIQPLTLIQISFTGATENYPLGTTGSDTGDDIFDKVRDPNSVLASS